MKKKTGRPAAAQTKTHRKRTPIAEGPVSTATPEMIAIPAEFLEELRELRATIAIHCRIAEQLINELAV